MESEVREMDKLMLDVFGDIVNDLDDKDDVDVGRPDDATTAVVAFRS